MNTFVIHCYSIPDVMVKVRQPHPPQMCWRIHLANTKHPEDGHGTARMEDTITRLNILWLIRRRFMTSVNTVKTRSFPGADIGSDHDLVMMSFRLLKEDKNAGPHKD